MESKDVLEFLKKNAQVPEVAEQLKDIFNNPLVVKPKDLEVTSYQHLLPTKLRMYYTFSTTSIDDFILYSQEHSDENSIVEIDDREPMRLKAQSVFDHGTIEMPLHREHRALIELSPTVAYQALMNADDNYNQRKLSDWLEDQADFIQVFDASGNKMSIATASSNVRTLTIDRAREQTSKIDDFQEEMSAMEMVAARNAESLPAIIKFTCTPFVGFDEYEFCLRVSIQTGGEAPGFTLRHRGLEYVQDQIARDFTTLIIDGLKESKANVYRANI